MPRDPALILVSDDADLIVYGGWARIDLTEQLGQLLTALPNRRLIPLLDLVEIAVEAKD